MKVTSSNGNQAGIRFSIFVVPNWQSPWASNKFHIQNMVEQEDKLDFSWVTLSAGDKIYAFVTGSNTELTFHIFWEEELYNRDQRYEMLQSSSANISLKLDIIAQAIGNIQACSTDSGWP
jgi:hypothetical protein